MIACTISIDTEVDHRGDSWVKSAPMRFRSVVDGIPQRLTPLFARHGARPTYLLTTEVMNDAASVDVLRRVPDAELGTHMHGEHVPPEATALDPAGTKSWDFNCCYPEELERRKLETITAQFRDRFARAPRSYRAGRYGASGRTARLLAELGYVADTSVTPGLRWANERQSATCAVDFRHAPLTPYRPSADDLARPGTLALWEIPITILPRPDWWNRAVGVYQRLRRRPAQAYPAWLRPSTTEWPWLRWIVERAVAAREPLTVLNIMFHSMELVPDASPYAPTERDAQRILRRLDRLLHLIGAVGARHCTVSELAELLSARS